MDPLKIDSRNRGILLFGIVLAAILTMFPPWTYTGDFSPIWRPPGGRAMIDFRRFGLSLFGISLLMCTLLLLPPRILRLAALGPFVAILIIVAVASFLAGQVSTAFKLSRQGEKYEATMRSATQNHEIALKKVTDANKELWDAWQKEVGAVEYRANASWEAKIKASELEAASHLDQARNTYLARIARLELTLRALSPYYEAALNKAGRTKEDVIASQAKREGYKLESDGSGGQFITEADLDPEPVSAQRAR